jgi:2-methylcitrate dehydratase PrpD
MAAHSLEFDDYSEAAAGHPGSVIIPASIAFAQEQGLSGADVVRGITIGYEVFERLGRITKAGSMHARGFHATAVMGPLAAAAACASARDPSDSTAIQNALGIAGSASGGLMAFLEDGSWTKRFHGGWAGTGGLVAAELGALGFLGPQSVIDGPTGVVNSFGSALHDDVQAMHLILSDVPNPTEWAVQKAAYKMFACCGYLHAMLTSAFDLMKSAPGVGASDIESIEVGLFRAAIPIVAEPQGIKQTPRNAVDSQFSAFHAMAVAVIDRVAGVAQFTDTAAQRPDIDMLRRRIAVNVDEEIEARFPEKYGGSVSIVLRDGNRMEGTCLDPFGSSARPPTTGELDQKFLDGAVACFENERTASDLLMKIRRMEEVQSWEEVFEGL